MSIPSDEADDLAAARQELDTLEKLSEGLSAQISELVKRPSLAGKIEPAEFALLELRHPKLKAYEELAHCCYGRTTIGVEIDNDGRPLKHFSYRITQANVGFIEKDCFVLARNSPLASALVTAQPGDDAEITTPRNRHLKIDEVRVFDGPTSLRSPHQKPNFRSMAIRRLGSDWPSVLKDLRATIRALDSPVAETKIGKQAGTKAPPTSIRNDLDATWPTNWDGIYLSESAEAALGHEFITRTTRDQERALSNPRGLTFVEGIAGGGKTSVALGRLKFFANFGTGTEREYYELQQASDRDFAPIGMMGFVLSHSLKRYLKETANALGLEQLPIRDFEEFRTDLSGHFGITERFRRKKQAAPLLRGRVSWLRAIDASMARSAGFRLRENLANSTDVPKKAAIELSKIANELVHAEPQPNSKIFHLSGLAARIVNAVAEAELQEREAAVFRPRSAPYTEQYPRERASWEREMRRIQTEAEKKIVSPLARALLSGLTSPDLISRAVTLDAFPTLVRQAFGNPTDPSIIHGLDDAINDICSSVQTADRNGLTDTDIVVLTALAGMIADGFEHIVQSGELSHLYQMRRYTAVFIDEVQDFTENEILLMGMTATSTYNQITLSGDRSQRLQSAGTEVYEELFPWVPRQRHNAPIFLRHNFRQQKELATLSSGFRFFVQKNDSAFQPMERSGRAAVYCYEGQEHMANFILRRIRSVPQHASIAVITPTTSESQAWFDLLNDELAAYHRSALMSRRDDLTNRFNVHFTEVRETKGLEFDVVIVPNIASFALDTTVGRNQAYVAISRAKHALLIGSADNVTLPEIEILRKNNLVCIRDIPPTD